MICYFVYYFTLYTLLITSSTFAAVLALEHVLRVQGLIAEVSAGMWRRNGVEMWAQSVTYRSVHCSELMLDTGTRVTRPYPLCDF